MLFLECSLAGMGKRRSTKIQIKITFTFPSNIETYLFVFCLFADDMKMMFMICATELAVRNNSDWCTLQTEKEREIVNYASDLEVCKMNNKDYQYQ